MKKSVSFLLLNNPFISEKSQGRVSHRIEKKLMAYVVKCKHPLFQHKERHLEKLPTSRYHRKENKLSSVKSLKVRSAS